MPPLSPGNVAQKLAVGTPNRAFSIVKGFNAVLCDGTTGREIIAAVAAGHHLEIMWVHVANKTAAEVGFLFLQQDVAGTQIAAIAFSGPADGAGNTTVNFDPPLRLATATGLFGETDSVGDIHVTALALDVTD